jgi:hypothetical protein
MGEDISARCDAIEKCYEFMLAYAGQGLAGYEGSPTSSQVRDFLQRAADAVSGLPEAYTAAIKSDRSKLPEPYRAFFGVLERDARDSLAAIQLVLAQTTISSQLIDNLNASIHLRALLTDLFLIDEILKPQRVREKPAAIE